jgi:hypothetical protein
MLIFSQKVQIVAVSAEHLHWFELKRDIPGMNSDPCLVVVALFHSRAKVVQHGIVSQEITTQTFQDIAVSW